MHATPAAGRRQLEDEPADRAGGAGAGASDLPRRDQARGRRRRRHLPADDLARADRSPASQGERHRARRADDALVRARARSPARRARHARRACASTCILGHSERRQYDGETDDGGGAQGRERGGVRAAPDRGRSASGSRSARRGPTAEVIDRQLRAALSRLDGVDGSRGWRSPTSRCGRSAPAWRPRPPTRRRRRRRSAPFSRERDRRRARASVPILYGGSVTADNAAAFFAERDVDGALVGGASLKVDQLRGASSRAAAAAHATR